MYGTGVLDLQVNVTALQRHVAFWWSGRCDSMAARAGNGRRQRAAASWDWVACCCCNVVGSVQGAHHNLVLTGNPMLVVQTPL